MTPRFTAVILLAISFAICPLASAASVAATYAEPGLMPFSHFLLFVVIGFAALIAMKYNQEIEVLLGLCSTVAFGIAMWFSPYIYTADSFATVDATGQIVVTYSQLVTPQATFQIFFGMCFLFAAIYTVYVTFLRKSDEALEKKSIVR
jgi:hypothetical protein